MNQAFPVLALGTTNQAKKKAVMLATGMEPLCAFVPSGVSNQPMSEDETIEGAIHRAQKVLEVFPEAKIGLGLEGGLTYDHVYTQQWYLLSVCAAWDGSKLQLAKGLFFPIPNHIVERLRDEKLEMKQIIDELAGTEGSNHKEGAYGLFTEGRITRAGVFKEAVIAALTPYASRFYK